MKRNDFIKTCAAGVCGCGVLGLLAKAGPRPESGDGQTAAVPEGAAQMRSQLEGARERFAQLLAVMGEEIDETARGKILRRLGRECAQKYAPLFNAHRGDLDGFIARAAYDRPHGRR